MTPTGSTRRSAGADQPRRSRPTAGADQPRRSGQRAEDATTGSHPGPPAADRGQPKTSTRRPAHPAASPDGRRAASPRARQPGGSRAGSSGRSGRSGPAGREGDGSRAVGSTGDRSRGVGSTGQPSRGPAGRAVGRSSPGGDRRAKGAATPGEGGRRAKGAATPGGDRVVGRTGAEHPAGHGEDGGASLRLNKALSGAGLGSRRAVEELVRAGRVSVGGEVVHDLGRRVDPVSDRVEVDGSRVVLDERRRYWLLNKPAGVVSTAADPAGRATVVELVPEQPRVFPVGRLDRDTEGLLLLTNDGPLAYRLTHARYGIEKRYLAEVERLPADAPGRLRKGIELEDGFARPTRVRVVAGSGRRRMVEVVLVEGRNREVRRLLEAVGAPVRRLVRTAVGPIRLTGLAPGEFRPLRPEEIRRLYKAAGL
jgi:23S rRNA pseudouridine2605 synthase